MLPVLVAASLLVQANPEPANSLRDANFTPTHTRVSFSENFETGFVAGGGPGQNGWTGFHNAGDGFTIVPTAIPGFQQLSGRHTSDGSTFAGFEVLSPAFAIETGGLFADLVLAPVATGTLYQFVTLGNQNTFNTRINLNPDGTITALQVEAGVGVFAPTTGSWSPNTLTRLGVIVPGDGSLQIVQDGVQIFSGHDIPFALGHASLGIQQFRIYAQNAGGAAGAQLTFDNISNVVPAPGTLALLGFGGLVAIRRRR